MRTWPRPSAAAWSSLPTGTASLAIVFAGVVGAITWNLITWWFGLPSSSTHALIGGLVGSTIAAAGTVLWKGIVESVVLPMIFSPLVGFALGYLFMLAILWAFRNGQPSKLNRRFRYAQTVSAAAMSIGHGMQDAAKTIGIIVLALYVGGFQDNPETIPEWAFWSSATVLALGTYAGGWRIIRTLGRRIVHLGPPEGFAAETVASSVLYFNALVLGAPISTTHTITSAIMGVGATKKLSAVRWGVAGNIVGAWILTFPAAGTFGCGGLLHRPRRCSADAHAGVGDADLLADRVEQAHHLEGRVVRDERALQQPGVEAALHLDHLVLIAPGVRPEVDDLGWRPRRGAR